MQGSESYDRTQFNNKYFVSDPNKLAGIFFFI